MLLDPSGLSVVAAAIKKKEGDCVDVANRGWRPDYTKLSVSFVITVDFVQDRFGERYVGLGVSGGLPIPSMSFVSGSLTTKNPSQKEVSGFISQWTSSVGGGLIFATTVVGNMSNLGTDEALTSVERGISTPAFGWTQSYGVNLRNVSQMTEKVIAGLTQLLATQP